MKRKFLLIGILLLCNSAITSPLKLVEAIFDSQGLKNKLMLSGVPVESMNRMVSGVDASLNAFGSEGSATFIKRIRSLPVSEQDQVYRDKLLSSLSKDMSKVSSDEFIESMNSLYFLASRYGINTNILSCSVCVTDELAKIGVRNSISKIENDQLRNILTKIPSDARSLTKFIKRKSRHLNIEDMTKFLLKEDERTYALFLELASRQNSVYAEFANSVIQFNKTAKGTIALAGPNSKAQFWRMLNSNLSEEKVSKLSKIINSSSLKSEDSRVDEFFASLKESAKGEEDKLSAIEDLKSKSCFFN